jgi:hypothetical protein
MKDQLVFISFDAHQCFRRLLLEDYTCQRLASNYIGGFVRNENALQRLTDASAKLQSTLKVLNELRDAVAEAEARSQKLTHLSPARRGRHREIDPRR